MMTSALTVDDDLHIRLAHESAGRRWATWDPYARETWNELIESPAESGVLDRCQHVSR